MKYSDNKYLCRLTATSYNPLIIKIIKVWTILRKKYLKNLL